MKNCPVCEARCFDDMEICYGCLHRFGEELPEDEFEPDEPDEALAAASWGEAEAGANEEPERQPGERPEPQHASQPVSRSSAQPEIQAEERAEPLPLAQKEACCGSITVMIEIPLSALAP